MNRKTSVSMLYVYVVPLSAAIQCDVCWLSLAGPWRAPVCVRGCPFATAWPTAPISPRDIVASPAGIDSVMCPRILYNCFSFFFQREAMFQIGFVLKKNYYEVFIIIWCHVLQILFQEDVFQQNLWNLILYGYKSILSRVKGLKTLLRVLFFNLA